MGGDCYAAARVEPGSAARPDDAIGHQGRKQKRAEDDGQEDDSCLHGTVLSVA